MIVDKIKAFKRTNVSFSPVFSLYTVPLGDTIMHVVLHASECDLLTNKDDNSLIYFHSKINFFISISACAR